MCSREICQAVSFAIQPNHDTSNPALPTAAPTVNHRTLPAIQPSTRLSPVALQIFLTNTMQPKLHWQGCPV